MPPSTPTTHHHGPRCSICQHKDRKKINAALLNGATNISIQAEYGLSDSAVSRHRNNCIPSASRVAVQATALVEQGVQIGDIVEQSRTLYERALRLLDEVEERAVADNQDPNSPQVLPARDWNAITRVLREARGTLELYGRFTGALGANQTQPKDLLQHPAVQDFVSRIGTALLTTLTERLGDTTAQEILAEALTAIDAERRAATEQVPQQDRRLLRS